MIQLKSKAFIAFIVAFVLSATLSPVAPAAATTATVDVVALGDSYTSGAGALSYEDRTCYRSPNAYVHQYVDMLDNAGFTAHSYNYACLGKETADITGQIQLAGDRLSSAEIVVLTIGGNDGKFKDIVTDCLAQTRFVQLCHDDVNYARDRLDQTMSDTQDALLEIHDAAPNAEIVLIGYPYLVEKDCFADSDIVRSLQSAADTHAFVAVHELSNPSIHFLSVLTEFEGGAVCGDSGNLIRGTFDTFVTNYNEWFHPNIEGHTVIAEQLYNLGLHNGSPVSGAPAPSYQLPPPTAGQPVFAGLPFECGVVVPYVSTYDTVGLDGYTYNHGYALDMPMPLGTSVAAPESGTVDVHLGTTGYGKYVDLHGDSGMTHRFAHLQHTSVSPGERVERGQRVGFVGSTGASTGPHLHYEQRSSSGQIPIDLGGPSLQWGGDSGFRTTTHALVSGNCGVGGGSLAAEVDYGPEDIMTISGNDLIWGRSSGRSRDGWGVARYDVFTPDSTDSCDFDGDGFDEFIMLDVEGRRLMMANASSAGNGQYGWQNLGTVHTARKIVCGDWNGDGLDDVLMHNTEGVIYFGRSDGVRIAEWKVARLDGGSRPTFWDMCDMNGDGREEIVSYYSGSRQFVAGHRTDSLSLERQLIYDNVGGIGGFACGNFLASGFDELVAWNNGHEGRYLIGWLDNQSYSSARLNGMQPTGFTPPWQGEVVAGDIDNDGLDEFLVNERRPATDTHHIMVGNVTSTSNFGWHPFWYGSKESHLAVGNFVQ